MTEAGYPNGFAITFHGPNTRYVNDDQIMQTIAQMWARIGVKARVEAMPLAVYFGRASKKEFSVTLVGWGAQTGEASSPLRSLIACENKEKGFGALTTRPTAIRKWMRCSRKACARSTTKSALPCSRKR